MKFPGGTKRQQRMTPAMRTEYARKAANARWKKAKKACG